MGWVMPVQEIMGSVGLGPFAVGLGWVNKYGPMSISVGPTCKTYVYNCSSV